MEDVNEILNKTLISSGFSKLRDKRRNEVGYQQEKSKVCFRRSQEESGAFASEGISLSMMAKTDLDWRDAADSPQIAHKANLVLQGALLDSRRKDVVNKPNRMGFFGNQIPKELDTNSEFSRKRRHVNPLAGARGRDRSVLFINFTLSMRKMRILGKPPSWNPSI